MEHDESELEMARMRTEAFKTHPVAYTVWSTLKSILEASMWVAIIFLIAQCSCNGCMLP